MKIRKYIARNMPEALQQVRDDLGEQAVILNTRQIRRNNRFNTGDEARVEVMAALDESGAQVPAVAADSTSPVRGGGTGASRLAAQRYGAQSGGGPVPSVSVERAEERSISQEDLPSAPDVREPVRGGDDLDVVIRQLRQMQETLARVERRGSASTLVMTDALSRLSERLRNMGVAPALVEDLCAHALRQLSGPALEDRQQVGDWVADFLAAKMPACQHIRIGKRQKVIGFWGASGAGKTTAVAKIAAGFALKRKDKIVVVSADDRRIGGLDQARAFAHIIGVELETAYSEEEMAAVIERHAQAQLVLIDVPGCGPSDQRERERQRNLFDAAGVQEVHVVIDALNGFEHALDIVEASSGFAQRRLLFTKVDEVARPGAMLSTVIQSQIPTSYMTVGCQVPGDIEAGEMNKVVAQILGRAPGRQE